MSLRVGQVYAEVEKPQKKKEDDRKVISTCGSLSLPAIDWEYFALEKNVRCYCSEESKLCFMRKNSEGQVFRCTGCGKVYFMRTGSCLVEEDKQWSEQLAGRCSTGRGVRSKSGLGF